MADKDYKQIATDAARIIRGLVRAVQKRGGGHYSCINPEYLDMSSGTSGNYLTEAYQWLFKNCGIYWKEYEGYLTPEQQEKINKKDKNGQ